MTQELDFYTLLGVPRNASVEEVRRAYREAALRLHPDKNTGPGDTELFLKVNKAYEILSDLDQRTVYDQGLVEHDAELTARSSFRAGVIQSRRKLS